MSVICLIPQDNIFNPDWFKISGINGELNENDIKELSSNNEKKEMKRNINNNKGIEEITEKMIQLLGYPNKITAINPIFICLVNFIF